MFLFWLVKNKSSTFFSFSLEIDFVFFLLYDKFFFDKFKDRSGRITHDETKAQSLDLQKTFIVVEGRVSSSDVFLPLKKLFKIVEQVI